MLNEVLERKVKDAAKWFCDNPNRGDIEDALREMVTDAMNVERQTCWDEINAWIKPGELQGNGCDQNAQRNGLVLASNIVTEGIMRSNVELRGGPLAARPA